MQRLVNGCVAIWVCIVYCISILWLNSILTVCVCVYNTYKRTHTHNSANAVKWMWWSKLSHSIVRLTVIYCLSFTNYSCCNDEFLVSNCTHTYTSTYIVNISSFYLIFVFCACMNIYAMLLVFLFTLDHTIQE